MNYHLAEQLAKDRLAEARDVAATATLLREGRAPSEPLRVTVGLALIKLGRWMAGQAAKRSAGPRRATA